MANSVLVVEDDRIERAFLEQKLSTMGLQVTTAGDGKAGIEALTANKVDLIIMDRQMPTMDGLTAVHAIRQDPNFAYIPIIMVTGNSEPEDIQEGMDAGVFYYLSKPVTDGVLYSVVQSALRELEDRQLARQSELAQSDAFHKVDTLRLYVQQPNDVDACAAFVANCFPEPGRVLFGIRALLMNAVEHGNLEIGYKLKGALLRENRLHEEIQARLENPMFKTRKAELVFTRKDNQLLVIVKDQGPGFDYRPYLNIDPSRADQLNGRGIAQAQSMSFDQLKYNDQGNQVIGMVNNDDPLDW